MGDLDGDGAVTVRDALQLLYATVNDGLGDAQQPYYFHTADVSLADVSWMLNRVAQN